MTQILIEITRIVLPVIVTDLAARLKRKKDLKDLESGRKKTSDFHHFIK